MALLKDWKLIDGENSRLGLYECYSHNVFKLCVNNINFRHYLGFLRV